MVLNIAVIGAGVIGLSAAVSVQQNVQNAKVTLIADMFNERTTSWGAGGLFRVNLSESCAEERENIRRWSSDSWKFFTGLARSEQAQECGMSFASGTCVHKDSKDYSFMSELTHDYQELDEIQIKKMNLPILYEYAYSFTTVLINTPTYLRWLMDRFRENGGEVQCRKVSKLSEVRAPWFKNIFFSDDLYVIPHNDYVCIGGIKDSGNWNQAADPVNRNAILSRAYTMFPDLKHAPITGEWVGLRPGRNKVRLEAELIRCGGKKLLPVIHNYGHGGSGVKLSWGCALQATQLVQELANGLHAKL